MALWTDIIDPQTLTEYARNVLADYEASRGNLARYLPNRTVADIVVRFIQGDTGLQEEARFRAYDAPLEMAAGPTGKRITLELPALGTSIPSTEYDQLRANSGSIGVDAGLALTAILQTTDRVVRAVADRMERLRGSVLVTGNALVAQDNFQLSDTFGRDPSNTIAYSASSGWDDPSVDRMQMLRVLCDHYREVSNGGEPGSIVLSDPAYNAFRNGTNMRTVLVGGATRLPGDAEVANLVSADGLPPIERYNRRTRRLGVMTRVLPSNVVLILPAPVDTGDYEGTDLGATFWGQTLSSREAGWAIPVADQPGVVVGAFRNDDIPFEAKISGDAIGEPVLANGNLSLAVTVLPTAA